MKKTILLAIAAVISLAAMAQAKKDTIPYEIPVKPLAGEIVSKDKQEPKMLILTTRGGKVSVNAGENSDTLRIAAAGTLAFQNSDGRGFSYVDAAGGRELAVQIGQGNIPLYVSIEWVIALYQYMQTSKNAEFTLQQLDQIKAKIMPIIQVIQRQQQKPVSPSKQ